jgi:hypothetical protein
MKKWVLSQRRREEDGENLKEIGTRIGKAE